VDRWLTVRPWVVTTSGVLSNLPICLWAPDNLKFMGPLSLNSSKERKVDRSGGVPPISVLVCGQRTGLEDEQSRSFEESWNSRERLDSGLLLSMLYDLGN